MEQTVWLFLGGMALLVSAGALSIEQIPRVVNQLGVAFATVLWFYWAIAAGEITVTTSCCVQEFSYHGAMFLGLGAGLITAFLLVDSVFGVVGLSEPQSEEVAP